LYIRSYPCTVRFSHPISKACVKARTFAQSGCDHCILDRPPIRLPRTKVVANIRDFNVLTIDRGVEERRCHLRSASVVNASENHFHFCLSSTCTTSTSGAQQSVCLCMGMVVVTSLSSPYTVASPVVKKVSHVMP